jgi:hypothetical protein
MSERKAFFFEKKKQKTFTRWSYPQAGGSLQAAQRRKKFFASFFQKRRPSFL